MPVYVAFLRAINVGGHTVKMDHLRRLFEALGFSRVETFIASGNVIFESKSRNAAALERKIETHLAGELGYAVVTFLRSTTEVVGIADYRPFSKTEMTADGNQLHVGFLSGEPSAGAKQKLQALSNVVNAFHIHGREVYWLRRTKAGESEFASGLFERTLGMKATFRNSTTVKRIAAKYPAQKVGRD
jgi:uncharacterized protein (DUF1697 family)